MIKLKLWWNSHNSNCFETQKLKLWQNSKIQIVMKLKNSNGDKTEKLKLWPNWKTQIVTKLNSNCEKTQIMTKFKLWENKLKAWNVTSQIVTKLEISNYDKTQKLKLWQNLQYVKCQFRKKTALNGLLVRIFWHLDNRWDVLWASFCDSRGVFLRMLNIGWQKTVRQTDRWIIESKIHATIR